jgi:murein DD-endopeptidase MepM/ murein hydrolase activator NlpD
MGDVRADVRGPGATASTGKRVARHAAEQVLPQPYTGRRVARPVPVPPPAPEPEAVREPSTPYVGRRIARVVPEPTVPPSAAPEAIVVESFVAEPVVIAPVVITPVAAQPAVLEPSVLEPPLDLAEFVPTPAAPVSAPETTTVLLPSLDLPPVLDRGPSKAGHPLGADRPSDTPLPPATRPSGGRRVADRRSRRRRMPSLPLLGGIAVLALSAGGALQAVSPTLTGSSAQHLSPASALSGSSAVASTNLLGSRGTVVSRDSDRLQAAADAKVKTRDQALSAFAAQAQKQAADIKLHQWVLPVTSGVYHLTARFGEYSYLWSNMHTGLDFAAPTGTPIMAVASGTITEVGYSGAYGNRTIETLPDGTELWYCHQNEFGTSVGASVSPGQVIGYVGSTGNVTGPHLHLEVHPGGGDPVDPFTALEVHGLHP